MPIDIPRTRVPGIGGIFGRVFGPVGVVIIIQDILDIILSRRTRRVPQIPTGETARLPLPEIPLPMPQPLPLPLPEIITEPLPEIAEPFPEIIRPRPPISPPIDVPIEIPTTAPQPTPAPRTPRAPRPPRIDTETPVQPGPVATPGSTTRPGTRSSPRIGAPPVPGFPNVGLIVLPGVRLPAFRLRQREREATPRVLRPPELLPPIQDPMNPMLDPISSFQPGQQVRTRQGERECQEQREEEENRIECAEGFYEEFVNSTEFVEWRVVDCVTRKAIPDEPTVEE